MLILNIIISTITRHFNTLIHLNTIKLKLYYFEQNTYRKSNKKIQRRKRSISKRQI